MTCSDVNQTLSADGAGISALLKNRLIDRVKSGLSWAVARTPYAESGQESLLNVVDRELVPKRFIGREPKISSDNGLNKLTSGLGRTVSKKPSAPQFKYQFR